MKQRTTIDAGAIVYVIETGVKRQAAEKQKRAPKKNPTKESVRLRNKIQSQNNLEMMLAVNFPAAGSANVVTLSFDDRHLPKTYKQTRDRVDYFLNGQNKLCRRAVAAGLPRPRAIWSIECLSAESQRWHVHMVIDSAVPIEVIRACWTYGDNIECRKLRTDDEKDHATLARYISKESREAQDWTAKPGQHAYGFTQNCLRPTVDVQIVDGSAKLRAPRNATVLIHERRETAFDEVAVLKYRLPGSCFRSGVRRRRRRRR